MISMVDNNKVSGKKSNTRAKLKAVIQEERPQKWKEYFQNLQGKSKIIEKKQLHPA